MLVFVRSRLEASSSNLSTVKEVSLDQAGSWPTSGTSVGLANPSHRSRPRIGLIKQQKNFSLVKVTDISIDRSIDGPKE